jgi:hypothetical protein
MRNSKHKITFSDDGDAEALARAMLGRGNKFITQKTGLTDGQITYRLGKAKRILGLNYGFRAGWSNGRSYWAKMVESDMLAIIKREVQAKLPPQISHLKPQGASERKTNGTY